MEVTRWPEPKSNPLAQGFGKVTGGKCDAVVPAGVYRTLGIAAAGASRASVSPAVGLSGD